MKKKAPVKTKDKRNQVTFYPKDDLDKAIKDDAAKHGGMSLAAVARWRLEQHYGLGNKPE